MVNQAKSKSLISTKGVRIKCGECIEGRIDSLQCDSCDGRSYTYGDVGDYLISLGNEINDEQVKCASAAAGSMSIITLLNEAIGQLKWAKLDEARIFCKSMGIDYKYHEWVSK